LAAGLGRDLPFDELPALTTAAVAPPATDAVDIALDASDAARTFGFAAGIGSTADDYGFSVAADAASNVYATGGFQGTVDVDPGAAQTLLASAGSYDGYLVKSAPSGAVLWARSFGGTSSDITHGVALAADGGVLVTGEFSGTATVGTTVLTSAGSADIFLAKWDADGNFLWAQSVGGTGYDRGDALAVGPDGSIAITGWYNGTVDFDPGAGVTNFTSSGGDDIFVCKFNAAGGFLWAQAVGGIGADHGKSVAFGPDGSVSVAGYFSDTVDFDPGAGSVSYTSAGGTDAFVAQFDTAGSLAWANAFGGANSDVAYGVNVASDGSVFSTGYFVGTVDFNPGSDTSNLISAGGSDVFVSKLTSAGAYGWARRIGGASSDFGYGIELESDGSLYLSGQFQDTVDFDPGSGTFNVTSAGMRDAYIAQLDFSGNFIAAQAVGGTGDEYVYDVALAPDGGVYAAGEFSGTADFDPSADVFSLTSAGGLDAFVVRLNPPADDPPAFGFARHMGGLGVDAAYALATDAAGNSYIAGYFNGLADFDPGPGYCNLISVGDADVFVAKYSPGGALLWARAMGGADADYANGIAVGSDGNVYTTGYFAGTIDLDPSSNDFNLTSVGGNDAFVTALDAAGNFLWAAQVGSTGSDIGYGIAVAPDAGVYVTGYFSGAADFDPGSGTYNLSSAGSSDAFLLKLTAGGAFTWARRWGGTSTDGAYGLAIGADSSVSTTGWFVGTVDFNPGAGVFNITSNGSRDVFASRLDADGNFAWAAGIGGTGTDNGSAIAVASDGGVALTGTFVGSADFDPGSGVTTLASAGGTDVFVMRLDATGGLSWARGMGGAGDDYGYAIALADNGSVNTTGYFNASGDFDPEGGVAMLYGVGNEMFVSSLDAAGHFAGARSAGGTGGEYGRGLAALADGSLLVAGNFSNTADFDPTAGIYSLTPAQNGYHDIYLLRLLPPHAPSNFAVSCLALPKGSAVGTIVGLLSVADADPNERLTYALVGGAGSEGNAAFRVDGNVLETDTLFGASDPNSYNIRLRVTDHAGLAVEQTFVVQLVPAAETSSVGDRVWNDLNSDGLQDPGEPGVAGAVVEVFSTADGLSRGVAVTDAAGNYTLDQLVGGVQYRLSFRPPVGYTFTQQDVGSDDADSDADAMGQTAPFMLSAGTSNTSLDAGLVGAAPQFGWAIPGGTVGLDLGQSMAVDAAGNVYIADAFQGTADYDPGPGVTNLTSSGNYNLFFAKYTASGALLWIRQLTSPSSPSVYEMTLDAAGNVCATGWFSGTMDFDPGLGVTNLTSAGSSDVFVLKLDAAGNFLWARSFGSTSGDYSRSLAIGPDNTTYVCGEFYGTADFDPGAGIYNLTSAGGMDAYVVKLDATGNLIWAASLGGTSDELARHLAVGADGSAYVTGQFGATADFDPGPGVTQLTAAGTYDAFLCKLTPTGGLDWVRGFGGPEDDQGTSVTLAADGAIYLTGSFRGTADFDPGPDTMNLTSAGAQDAFVGRFDATGGMHWMRGFGGSSSDWPFNIVVSPRNLVHLVGFFVGTADFDPSAATFNLTSAGSQDAFSTTLDADGNFIRAQRIGGTDYDRAAGIAVGADETFYLRGAFNGTVDFDLGTGAYSVTAPNASFVAKYLPYTVGDQVWYDTNRNGALDAGEAGVAGVAIDLYASLDDVVGNADDVFQGRAITGADGRCTFTGAVSDAVRYYLDFRAPAGYGFTNVSSGGAAGVTDGQSLLVGGYTPLFDLSAGQSDTRYAAGLAPQAVIVSGGRRVFYNHSTFDGNDPAATAADDHAIVTDATPLLPGQAATPANFTSYARGLNGVMIDVDGLPAGGDLSAADFVFKVGNTSHPATWAAAPTPSVSVRRGAGSGGTDRIELIWADGAIKHTWLQITVLATARTGLAASDVFYFGNSAGDADGDGTSGYSDLFATFLRNGQAFAGPSRQDVDGSGSVTFADLLGVFRELRRPALAMIAPPGAAASSPAALLSAGPTQPLLDTQLAVIEAVLGTLQVPETTTIVPDTSTMVLGDSSPHGTTTATNAGGKDPAELAALDAALGAVSNWRDAFSDGVLGERDPEVLGRVWWLSRRRA